MMAVQTRIGGRLRQAGPLGPVLKEVISRVAKQGTAEAQLTCAAADCNQR